MIFNHSLKSFGVFGILLPTICYTAELEPLWKPFPGPRDVGGCDADLQNLKDAYPQALLLVQAALDAFNNIGGPKPDDAKGAQAWDRQARMAKAMFNLDPDPHSGFYGSMRSTEAFVTRQYRRLRQSAGKANPTKRVYCTPDFMTFFQSGVKTPWGDPITSTFPNGAFAWESFDRWPASILPRTEGEDPDPEIARCHNEKQDKLVLAQTIPSEDLILWCELGLSKEPLLGKDAHEANSKVKPGDSMPVSMSSIFMHELFHLWGNIEIMADQWIARQDANGVIERPNEGTYGYVEGANLARLVPDDAVKNVDNYRVFATAMFLDQWDWSTADNGGKAVKLPEIQ